MGLEAYRRKRDFRRTPEPAGRAGTKRASPSGGRFLVHKHDATRLHYDLRLEIDGVLKSWAVPKGPSLDPSDKRLAVHVEDHPLEYGTFEGVIPEGQYGAGPVIVWDRGTWTEDPQRGKGYAKGHLVFHVDGHKLRGGWALIRMHGGRNDDGRSWLLVKEKDAEARRGKSAAIVDREPRSVDSGRSIEEVDEERPAAPAKGRATRARAKPSRGQTRPTLPGAVRAALAVPAAQLATLVEAAPEGDDWLHEIKFDGYRVLARIDKGKAYLFSRNRIDWTSRLPHVARALGSLPVESAVVDGELVRMQADGTTHFQGLQEALSSQDDRELRYYAFDLLHLDGRDLTAVPLHLRKAALRGVVGRAAGPVRLSEHVVGNGVAFHEEACARGLEGIVSKRADGPHVGRRTLDWRKVRCGARQELVIGGFTAHSADPRSIGALLLGVHDAEGRLRFAGRVGTGFSARTRAELARSLGRTVRATSPFQGSVAVPGARWVDPVQVAEVTFTEWTRDGRLRHPVFVGLRADKSATSVVREDATNARASKDARDDVPGDAPRRESRKPATAVRPRRAETTPVTSWAGEAPTPGDLVIAGVHVTHPDRVLWPEQGITKRQLAAYYEAVAERLLANSADRPLMLYRCPSGRAAGCFFQKHVEGEPPRGVHVVQTAEEGGSGQCLTIDGREGLVSLVQMGALELHGWGARSDRPDRPDRIVFDLDPAPELPFLRVVDAAKELREGLESVGLRSFVKTTGGKGLHLEVPLVRAHTWETVKGFSRAVAEALVTHAPSRYVASASKKLRTGRIFIDWLRNGRGATSVLPYSTRARPGAPVATPLAWDEVNARLRPDRFTIETVPARVAGRSPDPWADFRAAAQRLPSIDPGSSRAQASRNAAR